MSSPGGVWAKVYPDSMVLGNGRNLLYNGAMQVAQRGTSKTGITANGYYTADRWMTSKIKAGTWTQTVESDAPSGSGFAKSCKLLCTTEESSLSADAIMQLGQYLEGQDVQSLAKGSSASKQLTVSFWVKSNVTETFIVYLLDVPNARQVCASYSINEVDTWERKTVTFSADTSGAMPNNNERGLGLYFVLASGSDRTSGTLQETWGDYVPANNAAGQTNLAAAAGNYWQITGVQLEVGETATSFEHKRYGTELAECQRYYQIIGGGTGIAKNANEFRLSIQAIPELRAAPTVEQRGTVQIDDPGVQSLEQSSIGIQLNVAYSRGAKYTLQNYSGLEKGKPYLVLNWAGVRLDAEL